MADTDEPLGLPGAEEREVISLDLGTTSAETIQIFVQESDDHELFEEILEKNKSREDVLQVLLESANTPDDIRVKVAKELNVPVPTQRDIIDRKKREAEQRARELQAERMVQKIQRMTVSEKIKLAHKGGGEARNILIKESNKLIIMAVLENPRITDGEIEAIARNRSALEDALRAIAANRQWTKNYAVQLALVQNPKTPPALAMRFIPLLKKRDIGLLEKNKNVSEAVRTLAKKLAKTKKG